MTIKKSLIAFAVTLLTIPSVMAHHSFSQFDRDTQRIIKGEVQRWVFNNPHVWMDITTPEGENFSFEGGGLVHLLGNGITGDTFKSGDQVTVMYCPLRDGRNGGAIGFAKIGDGPMINPNDGGCWVTDETKAQWEGWLEQGYTSNHEALAATQ